MPATGLEQERYKKLALVIVDMQNDFCRVGAPLEVPTSRDTIEAHRRLIAAFRERELPVIYTRFISWPERYIIWNWSPQCLPDTKCCWKDHKRFYADTGTELECSEIIDELAPLRGDLIIDKYNYGAFHGTSLDDILRARGITSLAVTGTVTQVCVEETAREAFHHGYLTTMISDAVSSWLPDLHDASLKNFAMKFGWVNSSQEFMAGLP